MSVNTVIHYLGFLGFLDNNWVYAWVVKPLALWGWFSGSVFSVYDYGFVLVSLCTNDSGLLFLGIISFLHRLFSLLSSCIWVRVPLYSASIYFLAY